MGISTDPAGRKHPSALIADINKTRASNLGANKLPPKNALFRLWKKKAFFEMPFDTCLFILSHKLNCAFFCLLPTTDNPKEKPSFHPYLRRHFSTACSVPNVFSQIVIMTIPKNEGARCTLPFLQNGYNNRETPRVPLPSATLNGI